MDNWRDVLRSEFEADDGSFLIKIRVELFWDEAAFDRMTLAMEACCRATKRSEEKLDRWIAEGFWYVTAFVQGWTQHPNFPRPRSKEYYEARYLRLFELGEWYFHGLAPWRGAKVPPLPVE